MRVIIDKQVHLSIKEFYSMAMELHPSLDLQTVLLKVYRLYEALEILGRFPYIYSTARFKNEWIKKQYRVLVCEDFLFAYKIYTNPKTKETYVYVHDAVHSRLYY